MKYTFLFLVSFSLIGMENKDQVSDIRDIYDNCVISYESAVALYKEIQDKKPSRNEIHCFRRYYLENDEFKKARAAFINSINKPEKDQSGTH